MHIDTSPCSYGSQEIEGRIFDALVGGTFIVETDDDRFKARLTAVQYDDRGAEFVFGDENVVLASKIETLSFWR